VFQERPIEFLASMHLRVGHVVLSISLCMASAVLVLCNHRNSCRLFGQARIQVFLPVCRRVPSSRPQASWRPSLIISSRLLAVGNHPPAGTIVAQPSGTPRRVALPSNGWPKRRTFLDQTRLPASLNRPKLRCRPKAILVPSAETAERRGRAPYTQACFVGQIVKRIATQHPT